GLPSWVQGALCLVISPPVPASISALFWGSLGRLMAPCPMWEHMCGNTCVYVCVCERERVCVCECSCGLCRVEHSQEQLLALTLFFSLLHNHLPWIPAVMRHQFPREIGR